MSVRAVVFASFTPAAVVHWRKRSANHSVDALVAAGVKKVYAAARNISTLEPLVVRHGSRVVPLELDATNAAQIATAAATATDLLVNNAGVVGFFGGEFTDSKWIEGGRQNTQVFGVYPGPIDTRMAEALTIEKASPSDTARAIVAGIIAGNEEIFPDKMSQGTGAAFFADPKGLERQVTELPAVA